MFTALIGPQPDEQQLIPTEMRPLVPVGHAAAGPRALQGNGGTCGLEWGMQPDEQS